MVSITAKLRVARPTDNLESIAKMYIEGLGYDRLGSFSDHNGFDGVILGHPQHHFHLEFTHHQGVVVGKAPTKDNLLVFYVPDKDEWNDNCKSMIMAGFKQVESYNPYWDTDGVTFEDVDGYRVVIQNKLWTS